MKKFYSLLLLLLSFTVFGQSYTFTQYNTSNSGIGFNGVTDIKTDSSGTLWLVSDYNSGANGISKFDGTNWVNYNTANSSIPSNMVTDLEVDGQNRKWIATYQNGVAVLNGSTWTTYTTANSPLPSNSINDIAIDGLGNIWIGSSAGLTKFNGTTWVTYNTVNSNIFSNNVQSVGVNNVNAVYIVSNGVFSKLTGSSFSIIIDDSKSIAKIKDNTIYLNRNAGYSKVVNDDVSASYMYEVNSCLLDCRVEALDLDENNNIWLGFFSECSSGGVQKFTTCTNYTNLNTGIEGLATVGAMKVINSNTIWVGSFYYGLIKMSASACNPPTDLSVNTAELTSTSVNIQWTAPTPAPAGYNYVYNTENTVGGSDGYTTGTAAWIDNLTPNTTYYWWVASDCEPQQWIAGGSFTTLPAPVITECFKSLTGGGYSSGGIKANGTLWGWGEAGPIGSNSATTNVPKPSSNPQGWEVFSMGRSHGIGIKANGTLWTWGSNQSGKLGHGNIGGIIYTNQNQVGTANNWKTASAGFSNSYAIKTDGTLWGAGSNGSGQLGNTNTAEQHTFIQIGTASNWKSVNGGDGHVVAIKTDGTLWAWGYNANGQVGDATTVNKTAPVQIGNAANWLMAVAGRTHSIAIKTDGTLWAWGSNTYGQLGDNTTTSKSSPVQIGTATWKYISADENHTAAIKADGTLWAWGQNNYGQLGNGSTINKSIPTQVGANSDWKAVASGINHTLAITNTGALRTWGRNDYGQLGNGTNIQYNVPGTVACPDSTLGNEEFGMADLKYYPNPVSNVLHISFDKEITAIALYNIMGQEVIVKAISATEGTVDISNLSAGTYLVKVTSGAHIKTLKVIKK